MSANVKNDKGNVSSNDEKRQIWIKRSSIIVAIWGVLSLFFTSPEIGVIFIIFALIIYLTKNLTAIYGVGILLWVIAIVELFNITGPLGIKVSSAEGPELIIVAVLNFIIGALFIYKTWQLKRVG
ncbi:MAG: hypothetical protein QME14_00845 [Methanobacteriaceae archaeon]|nr:hypothetical protein [Methanobacteriaceae archaeon]